MNDIYDTEEALEFIEIKTKLNDILTICIYLNSSNNFNQKKFYNKIQPHFDKGAKLLFKISSSKDYHNNVIKFFLDNDWTIPKNGRCKLFVEINNSKDLNLFIELLNKSLNHDDPINKINTIIGKSLLDKIVFENYINQFKSENQKDENLCWAFALSAVIYLRNCSIFGRKIQKFGDILNKVIEEKKNAFGDKDVYLKHYPKIIKEILNIFKLKCKEVDCKQARLAVMKGRPCLCIMYLEKNRMKFFNKFFGDEKNKKEIFTNEKFQQKITEKKYLGHVVVLTSIEEDCLKFLNSYGNKWGDEGYFRLKDEKVFGKFGGLDFLDVYLDESDLSKEENDLFNNNYLYFIKQASNYLSDSSKDIKQELEKEFECPKCKGKFCLKNFELKYYQKHIANNDVDSRKLKIECLKCHEEFESDSLTTLLYLYNIIC